MPTETPTVADIVVQRLREAGVLALFGMPGGGSNLDLIDAAGRAGVPFVLTATETGAAIAAVAQAEITGRLAACLTTLGPGVASVMNGVACASLDRAPVIVFTDCYPSSAGDFAHQRFDHRALMAPVTKWSATLSAAEADAVMIEAVERALTGPRGPVHIDVPFDVSSVIGHQSSVISRWSSVDQSQSSVGRTTHDSGLTVEQWRLMSESRRPLLLVGLGACRPADTAAIRAFCHDHAVPAMVTYKAKGVIPDDDPHFAGVFTNATIERPILNQADLLIGVGFDPVELLPRPWTHRQPIVSINSWRVGDAHVPFVAQLVGDIAAGLDAVGERLSNIEWNLSSIGDEVASQRRLLDAGQGGFSPDRVVRTAAQAARGVRVTLDAGAHMLPATVLWPVAEPHGMLVSNGLSTMGFALPAAIGAALVDRDRPVVALTGDGGLLICAGELLTAAREGLRVITVVFSDASLSLIAVKQQQRKLTPAGVALGDVAWCALAESLGVTAHFASTETELEAALSDAMSRGGPSLIEARVDPSAYGEILRAVRG